MNEIVDWIANLFKNWKEVQVFVPTPVQCFDIGRTKCTEKTTGGTNK
jgi:hypothetical protein